MTAPTAEREAHLRVVAWELALAGAGRNGARPADDVVWLVSHDAIRSPATAGQCAHVLAVLPPDVLAYVVTAQASDAAGTAGGAAPAAVAESPLGSGQAARSLGISDRAVRAACQRGALAATRDKITGAWRIDPAAVAEYGRTHGGQDDSGRGHD